MSVYDHGFARVTGAVPVVSIADPATNAERTVALLRRAADDGAEATEDGDLDGVVAVVVEAGLAVVRGVARATTGASRTAGASGTTMGAPTRGPTTTAAGVGDGVPRSADPIPTVTAAVRTKTPSAAAPSRTQGRRPP